MSWWILVIVALVFAAVGFKEFIWFLSVGYGFAVLGIGAALAIMSLVNGQAALFFLLMCAALIVYGIRLGGFLLVRELKNAAYKKTLDEATGNGKKIPFFVSLAVWISVGFLYFAQCSPVYYRLINGKAGADWAMILGVVISVCGILLEAMADKQKSAQKAVRPDMVAKEGLYKLCRCPNYFGEILLWTGVFVSGLTALQGWQWLVSCLGYVAIVYIMFNGAQRLEKRQMARYVDNAEYREYADKTPIIIPFLPIYHLNKEAE